jgi:hypothetical protein
LEETAEDIGLGSNEQGNGLLDVEAALGDKQNTDMIGEAGTVSVDENWTTVSLSGSYTDPVVVTSVGTYNDPDPVHARVRNAQSGSFEVRLEEWEYQDGVHSPEAVQYIVMEAGEHDTEAGMSVLAGKASVDGSWTTVTFSTNWGAQSHVYTQVMSTNDSTPTSTRVTRAGKGQFDVICQEEETNRSGSDTSMNDHATETVGFITTQPQPRGNNAGVGESVASSLPSDQWSTNSLQESYTTTPVVVHRMQSYFGRNTTDLRTRNLSTSSFDIVAQEEQSRDTETGHVPEYVATMAFESGPINQA